MVQLYVGWFGPSPPMTAGLGDWPMRWWTSDLHLGHEKILRYAHRPFSSANQMNGALIDAWNRVVAPGDEVWVLGDFAVGGSGEHLGFTARLNGRKTLVAGNRDLCWAGKHHGPKRWTTAYLEAGFEGVRQGPVTVDLGGRRVLAGHFPYDGDPSEVDRHANRRPPDLGAWLLHGHVHDKWRQDGRQVNVGVDAWGGRPVSDDELHDLVEAGPGQLAPRPWDVSGS